MFLEILTNPACERDFLFGSRIYKEEKSGLSEKKVTNITAVRVMHPAECSQFSGAGNPSARAES